MSNRNNSAEVVGAVVIFFAIAGFAAIYAFAKNIGADPSTTFHAVWLSIVWGTVIGAIGYFGRSMIPIWTTTLLILGALAIVWSPVAASVLLHGADPDATVYPWQETLPMWFTIGQKLVPTLLFASALWRWWTGRNNPYSW